MKYIQTNLDKVFASLTSEQILVLMAEIETDHEYFLQRLTNYATETKMITVENWTRTQHKFADIVKIT